MGSSPLALCDLGGAILLVGNLRVLDPFNAVVSFLVAVAILGLSNLNPSKVAHASNSSTRQTSTSP